MSQDLKPCPFCGNEPEPCPQNGYAGGFSMWCPSCSADGPDGHTGPEAIDHWNRRAEGAPAAEGARPTLTTTHHIGFWVYERIEEIIDAAPGTPEAAELVYLASIVEPIEQHGEGPWPPGTPSPTLAAALSPPAAKGKEGDKTQTLLNDAYAALRSIAEGNLGDQPWQANYETIRQVARNALSHTPAPEQFAENANCPAPSAEPVALELGAFKSWAGGEEVVRYIARYGGMCRGCADEHGICPGSGLPCEDVDKPIRHVLEALSYGLKHGYITLPDRPQQPVAWVVDAQSERGYYSNGDAWIVARKLPVAISREELGKAIYLAMYEPDGALWEANHTKHVWYEAADRLRARMEGSPSPVVGGAK